MQPTIELEICSYPAGTENPTERFVRNLISEAKKPAGEHQWKRLQAPKDGFTFRVGQGHAGDVNILIHRRKIG